MKGGERSEARQTGSCSKGGRGRRGGGGPGKREALVEETTTCQPSVLRHTMPLTLPILPAARLALSSMTPPLLSFLPPATHAPPSR